MNLQSFAQKAIADQIAATYYEVALIAGAVGLAIGAAVVGLALAMRRRNPVVTR